jgi:tetraacyldisaccharide 4'-kinase
MTWLDDLWWKDERGRAAPLLPALAAAELLFRGGVAIRCALHEAGVARSVTAPVPVISVGNLVVGGAGKTPAAIAISERLRARGRRVAVLSRGYGARAATERVVSDGQKVLLAEPEAGDEPLLVARRLEGVAVLCGPRRAPLAARAVRELGCDVLVLDDGFQHRALARDLDVVVVDAASPAGNGRLLPRGPNREPWSALGRAHLAWIGGADRVSPAALASLCSAVREVTGGDPVVVRHAARDVRDGTLERSLGSEALRGRRVLMSCAIGRPDRFRETLSTLGAEVVRVRAFRDHRRLDEAALEAILREAREARCEAVATTEKDAVRLPERLARDPLWHVVRIETEIVRGGEILETWIERALAAGDSRRRSHAGDAGVAEGA